MKSGLFFKVSGLALLAASAPAWGQTAQQERPSTGPVEGAQQTTQEQPTAPPVNADGSATTEGPVEDVVVTGSRIRLPNIEGFEPVTVVNQEYLIDRGLTNAANALNEIPGIRGSVTPNQAQGSFGQGVNFINTFGLGSNRTLTLINGRRAVSSNVNTIFNQGSAGVQVDVNIIPTLLVDRTDIVYVGGAPTYGSDAIAGTVNFILDTRITGVRAQATTSVTEQGDGFRYNAAIAGGFNFAGDRGNITLAYTRDQQDGVLFNARDFLRANLSTVTNPSAAQAATLFGRTGVAPADDGRLNRSFGFNESTTDGVPPTLLIRNRTIPALTRGGLITAATRTNTFNAAGNVAAVANNFQFDTSGNLVPFNRGIRFVGGTEASGGDGFRFNDFSQITSDLERDIANAFLTFDLTENITLFAEGTYFHSRADELVQQPTFNSNLFGGLSGQLTFDVNNPFLTAQARQALVAQNVNRFQVSRASLDLADLTGFSTTDLYRIVVGERGEFDVFGKTFNFEISGQYGRADILDSGQDLNAQRFANAVNVTRNAAGQIVCNPNPAFQAAPGITAQADPACVPLNLFGEGLSDPAARAYVISNNETRARLQQTILNFNVGGSPFSLFGNDVGFNLGYEHRLEEGSFTPSPFQQQGLGRSVAILPVQGAFNVDEVFGEVLVPLVSPNNGLSFIHQLEVFGRGRYVDNTVNGGFFAWSAGGRFAPIPDITFRGNYTRSFRAPAITELFSPRTNTFTTVPDLCSPGNRNAGPVPEIRNRNCTAFLAAFPNATPLDAASATVPGQSGGNLNLENETANSFTYGVILQPRFIPGLSIAVDYVNIKIRDPIANLTVANIASACFDNEDFNAADPANGNAFCSQIRRFPAGSPGTAANGGPIAGQVVADPLNPGVSSGFVNGQRINFEGITAELAYSRSLAGLGLDGRVNISGNLFYVRRRLVDTTGVAPVRSDGTLNDPEFQGQLNLRYIGEGFGATVSANYIGEQLFTRVSRGIEFREIDQLDDFVIVNPSVYFDVDRKFRFILSVSNLFDRNGEKYFGEVIPASYTTALGGDLFGRTYSATVRLNF